MPLAMFLLSLKSNVIIRKGWFVAYLDLNKEDDSDSAKWILLHVVLSAHAH